MDDDSIRHATEKRLTRRELLVRGAVLGVGATAVGSVLQACGGDETTSGATATAAAQEPVTISLCSWGGVYQEAQNKAYVEPFMKANPNITIVNDGPTDYAKIKAMVDSGNVTWDVVDVQKDFGIGNTSQYCTKLDPAMIPFPDLNPELLNTDGYRAATIIASDCIAYRTDKYTGTVPTVFADFFDLSKFPGKRSIYNWASGSGLEMALLADGVPYEQLYPLDVDRALKVFDKIKKESVFWTTGAQSIQLLQSGEAYMGMVWNGRSADAKATGVPLENAWGQHFADPESFIIPKGSKNVDAAMKFIAWCCDPAHNAEMTKYIAYGPANSKAADKADPRFKEDLTTEYLDTAMKIDDIWWSENYDAVNEKWQNWVTG